MTAPEVRDIGGEIDLLYSCLLRRTPLPEERAKWIESTIASGITFRQLFDHFIASKEFQALSRIRPGHPVGHYYSPVVDPDELRAQGFAAHRTRMIESMPELGVTTEEIRENFRRLVPFVRGFVHPEKEIPGRRYYSDNGNFPLGDAIVLSAMIGFHRPKRIIEIGSGFSTACMLDAIDHFSLSTSITCVEPFPSRLRSRLRVTDHANISILEMPVQKTDPALYRELTAGDILFIDSTHVVKTGSDVCFELFDILTLLPSDVILHFHDIHWPFEYPDDWIFGRKYSWNEIYAVRAFLSYNVRFRIFLMNNYFGQKFRRELEATYGAPVPNPGGSLWVQTVGAA